MSFDLIKFLNLRKYTERATNLSLFNYSKKKKSILSELNWHHRIFQRKFIFDNNILKGKVIAKFFFWKFCKNF